MKRGLNYTHEACIDLIISRPGISQNEIALFFGYSATWISTVMQSDAFQAKKAARIAEIVDPILRATLEEQAKGLHARSMEILRAKLNGPPEDVPDQLALQVYKETARSLGYGARPTVVVQNNTTINQEIENHGDRLIGLLKRTRDAVEGTAEEIPDEQQGQGSGVHRASGGAHERDPARGTAPSSVQPGLPSEGSE